MEMAYMHGKNIDRDGIDTFLGINKHPRIRDGEWADMVNMSGEEFPCITTRGARGFLRSIEKPNGMIANGQLAWVDGTSFWYGGKEFSGKVADSPKTLVNMGAYIIIFPDKLRFNTVTEAFDPLENTFSTTGTVTASICTLTGQPYEYVTVKPEEPTNGQYYLDIENNALYVYSEALASWEAVPSVYVKISAPGIGAGFAVNDGVTFSGLDTLDGTHILRAVGTDHVIILGIIPKTISTTAGVTLSRTVPEMDYVCEQNNRLWGCRYGQQGDTFVNEIYACALGDPTNWAQFDGTSMDSYRLSLGSAGAFTGMVSHLGYVMAFKEDVIHKVYGNYPANFQVTDTRARGIARGSGNSAAIAQETLLYLSPTDVVAMGTGLPGGISDALAGMELQGGVGGIYKRKYYLGCKDGKGNSHLLVYDIDNNIWYREDGLEVLYATSCEGDLYLMAKNDTGCGLYTVSGELTHYKGSGAKVEEPEEWMLESGLIGLRYPEHKYISQFMVRMEAEAAETGGGSGGGSDTLTWDGNTEGLVHMNLGVDAYKVSDAVLTSTDFANGYSVTLSSAKGYSETIDPSRLVPVEHDGLFAILLVNDSSESTLIVSATKEAFSTLGLNTPAGTYIIVNMGGVHVSSLTINGYTGFGGASDTSTSITASGGTITWDGDVTGKIYVEYLCKVSDAVPTESDLAKGCLGAVQDPTGAINITEPLSVTTDDEGVSVCILPSLDFPLVYIFSQAIEGFEPGTYFFDLNLLNPPSAITFFSFTINGYEGFGYTDNTQPGTATVQLDVQYDNSREWKNVYEKEITDRENLRISIRPRHCDTMRYRLRGTGRVRLYSIVKHTETAEEW